MSTTTQSGRALLPVRRKNDNVEGAEVIDLVQLPRGTRPTPVAYLDYDEVERCREMECDHYQSCLEFAARVRWKSFHCRQCPQNVHRLHADRARPVVSGEGAAVIKLP